MLPYSSVMLIGYKPVIEIEEPQIGFGTEPVWAINIINNNGYPTLTALTVINFYDETDTIISYTGASIVCEGPGTDGVNAAVTNLIDNNSGTGWNRSGTSGGYRLIITFPNPVTVNRVELGKQLGGFDVGFWPKDWQLQKGPDSSNLTTVLTAWEPSWNFDANIRSWPQDLGDNKYKAFRWVITDNNGHSFRTVIEEVEIKETIGGSDKCTDGYFFASNAFVNEEVNYAFDNIDEGRKYGMPNTGGFLGYYMPNTFQAAQYTIRWTGTDPTLAPKSWTFEGTKDGTNWVVLDVRNNITWTVSETKTFNVSYTNLPVLNIAPYISGDRNVGDVLTVSTGTWYFSPTSYTYQWKKDGVNISGATNANYTITVEDEGELITCTVTAINSNGSTSATSNTVLAGAGFRYVEIRWTQNSPSGAFTSMSAANVFDLDGVQITPTGASGSPNYVEGSNGPPNPNLIDNNNSTWYCTSIPWGTNPYVRIDLGVSRQISRIDLRSREGWGSQGAAGFDIYLTDDLSTYIPVTSQTGVSWSGGETKSYNV